MSGLRMYNEPLPSEIDLYEQRGDGCWYPKEHRTRASDPEIQKGVGDVNSDEKGSGARFNMSKPPMHFIPLEQQVKVMHRYLDPAHRHLWEVFVALSKFEKREVPISYVMELLDAADLRAASFVWAYGANKYSAWNWAKGMSWSVPIACISRHVQAVMERGEEIDQESKCTHWGHIVCNILMLDHYTRYYVAGDDRPPASLFTKER